jgi:hypothetical protein
MQRLLPPFLPHYARGSPPESGSSDVRSPTLAKNASAARSGSESANAVGVWDGVAERVLLCPLSAGAGNQAAGESGEAFEASAPGESELSRRLLKTMARAASRAAVPPVAGPTARSTASVGKPLLTHTRTGTAQTQSCHRPLPCRKGLLPGHDRDPVGHVQEESEVEAVCRLREDDCPGKVDRVLPGRHGRQHQEHAVRSR